MLKDRCIDHSDSVNKTFIPVSRRELIKVIVTLARQSPQLDNKQTQQLRTLMEVVQTIYHARFHRHYVSLKSAYSPFNPDRDVVTNRKWTDDQRNCLQKTLFSEISALLQKANYQELDENDINRSLNVQMSRGLSIGVELDDYQQVLIYTRGKSLQKVQQRHWRSLYLKKLEVEIPIYSRLNMVFRFRSEAELKKLLQAKGKNRFDLWLSMRRHQRLMQDRNSDDFIFLRQFRDIPCSDLEMLFPNSTLRFTLLDKIKLTATGGAGTVGGVMAVISKLAIAVKPLTILIALIGFGGVLGRQVSNVLNQQNHYQMVLSKSLYTHSLDINVGVIAALLDQALDEEIKELLLAYFVILNGETEWQSAQQIKQTSEQILQQHFELTIDFEINDALTKLQKDGLLIKQNNKYKAVAVKEATAQIEKQWMDLYSATESLAMAANDY